MILSINRDYESEVLRHLYLFLCSILTEARLFSYAVYEQDYQRETPQQGAKPVSIFYMFSDSMDIFHAYTKNETGFNFPR